ncbi:cytosine deaminase [Celeribacter indicus]|uniref:Cytosine deaminase-like protein n=1 Tax=Celeribacter indicus TaxID=1208324 RepID=A0A0B5E608_9RHOB|nr:cytosine deaminase [Celeribacter indicus]AJE47767.1 cytosine deaminase-like protein [Celeribacter indicus]SDW22226.1 cytosine deaminase [Celeribacter indicus]
MSFCVLPSGAKTLRNVTVPSSLLGRPGDLTRTDLTIEDGKIASTDAGASAETAIDMKGAMAFPCFVDMHTHLDKGHIWPRAANPDGTFMGALETVRADHARWSAGDVEARMEFSLRAAYAHGTKAIRTHIDSLDGLAASSFGVVARMQEKWAGKIALQASCLVAIDKIFRDRGDFPAVARIVAEGGHTLGAVTYPVPDLKERLLDFFHLAMLHDLEVDFHVDETDDPTSDTLRTIAETVLELGFTNPVTVGHCCSISVMPEETADGIIALVAQAGLNVVSLPMCNQYLQDRYRGRTPRWRGVTMAHELKAAGVNVSFASDNTRDPFYAYGDLDMMEVMREATRICHLDHCEGAWVDAFFGNPARACGFDTPRLTAGAPADLVIAGARDWTELFARPQSDRIVLRDGDPIDRTLPAYSDLDELLSQ